MVVGQSPAPAAPAAPAVPPVRNDNRTDDFHESVRAQFAQVLSPAPPPPASTPVAFSTPVVSEASVASRNPTFCHIL